MGKAWGAKLPDMLCWQIACWLFFDIT